MMIVPSKGGAHSYNVANISRLRTRNVYTLNTVKTPASITVIVPDSQTGTAELWDPWDSQSNYMY